jgi:hypothetical protein
MNLLFLFLAVADIALLICVLWDDHCISQSLKTNQILASGAKKVLAESAEFKEAYEIMRGIVNRISLNREKELEDIAFVKEFARQLKEEK